MKRVIYLIKNILFRLSLIDDYVIEFFNDGPWYGRAWAGGEVEFWCYPYTLGSNLNFPSTYGNGYFREHAKLSFPIQVREGGKYKLIEPPSLTVTPLSFYGLLEASVNQITESTYSFYLSNSVPGSVTSTIYINVDAKGRWKSL